MNKYLPLIQGKNVGIVANQASVVGQTNIVDTLLKRGIKIVRIFSPEHGFSINKGAGEAINYTEHYQNIPVVSLYGKKKKPSKKDLDNLDIVLFDLQDVGVRFYTYISTLTYVMESCARYGIPVIVLDRVNPNGHFIDGPVLKQGFESFVGLHPVPIVYGMTIGEYAMMVNGEGWLDLGLKAELTVIPLSRYNRNIRYELSVTPSPNLRSPEAIWLYPSLCLFEGTAVSVGRGTLTPFEVIGYPGFSEGNYRFTPRSLKGIAENPKYKDMECTGFNLKQFARDFLEGYPYLYLYWLEDMYKSYPDKEHFFNDYFDKLAGTDELRKQIIQGIPVDTIRQGWEKDIREFLKIRSKYLIYPDYKVQAESIKIRVK